MGPYGSSWVARPASGRTTPCTGRSSGAATCVPSCHAPGRRPPPRQPVSGQWKRAGLEADHDVQLLTAVARVPEIHGPHFPRRLKLQRGGEQTRGIHASNLPDRHHLTPQPPTTNNESPFFHIYYPYLLKQNADRIIGYSLLALKYDLQLKCRNLICLIQERINKSVHEQ